MRPSPAPAYCRSTHSTEVRRNLHAVGYQGAILSERVPLMKGDFDWRDRIRSFTDGNRHGDIDAVETDE